MEILSQAYIWEAGQEPQDYKLLLLLLNKSCKVLFVKLLS